MTILPDPRHYGVDASQHPFNQLSESALRRELRDALANRRDAEISAALRAAPSHAAYAKLWHAVCDVAHQIDSAAPSDAIIARVFALPLVIITGSARPASLAGVIPDIAAVKTLLERNAALGPARNFGLSNALCTRETLEALKPSEVYAWTHAAAGAPRELEPSAIEIVEPGEKVHLRFLAGASITSASEPSFVETASNIGAWGMLLTRELAAQLTQSGIEILPLPRPPLDLLRAAHAGRVAQLDAAFSLFASNAVRRFRSATGDPVAVISAHDDIEIRAGLSSPFDDAAVDGFRWPLHPLDDIDRIVSSMTGLMRECRVNEVHCVERVLPALNTRGTVWFLTPRDLDDRDAVASRH